MNDLDTLIARLQAARAEHGNLQVMLDLGDSYTLGELSFDATVVSTAIGRAPWVKCHVRPDILENMQKSLARPAINWQQNWNELPENIKEQWDSCDAFVAHMHGIYETSNTQTRQLLADFDKPPTHLVISAADMST